MSTAQATAQPVVVKDRKKRKGRSASEAAVNVNASFYEGQVSPDGTVTSIGVPISSEKEALKSSIRTGNPFLRVEVLKADWEDVGDGIKAVWTPVKK